MPDIWKRRRKQGGGKEGKDFDKDLWCSEVFSQQHSDVVVLLVLLLSLGLVWVHQWGLWLIHLVSR